MNSSCKKCRKNKLCVDCKEEQVSRRYAALLLKDLKQKKGNSSECVIFALKTQIEKKLQGFSTSCSGSKDSDPDSDSDSNTDTDTDTDADLDPDSDTSVNSDPNPQQSPSNKINLRLFIEASTRYFPGSPFNLRDWLWQEVTGN